MLLISSIRLAGIKIAASWKMGAAILLYGVLHTFSQGLYALVIAAIFLALGLILNIPTTPPAQCWPGR